MEIAFRDATLEDIPTLAKMNRQLIEAEQSRNPMSLDELEERMRGFLRPKTQSPHGWSVVLILVDGQVAGYTVYRLGRDEYNASQPEVFIRHYMLKPEYRRRGIGKAAFEQLVVDLFPESANLSLNVLESNPAGRRFWTSLGFEPYSNLRREQRGKPESAPTPR